MAIDTSSRSATEQANERLVRQSLDAANRRDVDGLQKNVADEVKFVNPVTGPVDKEGMRGFHAQFFAGFPDIHYTIDRLVTEDQQVVVETTITGTHKGELMGMAATGRRMEITAAFLIDVADGKISKWHSYFDTATMLRQIGAMK
ncbi:MAG: ester cyclase [Chloroflexota bacterium]|nr:ester cyclase [Chloroflexota bacterium]